MSDNKDTGTDAATEIDILATSEKAAGLHNEVYRLSKRIAEFNSLPRVFLRGIVTGIGTAIGATIIAGLLITFLADAVGPLEELPILDQVLENVDLSEVDNNISSNSN